MNNQFTITGNKSIAISGVKSSGFSNVNSKVNFFEYSTPIYDESYEIAYDSYKETVDHLNKNLSETTFAISDFGAEVLSCSNIAISTKITDYIFSDVLFGSKKDQDKTIQEGIKKFGKAYLPNVFQRIGDYYLNKDSLVALSKTKVPTWCAEIPVFDMFFASLNYDGFSGEMVSDVFLKNGLFRYGKNLGNKSFGPMIESAVCNSIKETYALPGAINLKDINNLNSFTKICENANLTKIANSTIIKHISKIELGKFGSVAGVEIVFQFVGDFAMQLATTGEYHISLQYGDNLYKGAITTVFTVAGSFIELTPLGKPGKLALQAFGARLADKTLSFFVGDTAAETQQMRAWAGVAVLAGGGIGLVVGIFAVSMMTPPVGWGFAVVAGAILVGAAVGALAVWVIYNFDEVVDKIVEKAQVLVEKAVNVVSAITTTVTDFIVDTGAVIAETYETVKQVVEEKVEEVVEEVVEVVEDVVEVVEEAVEVVEDVVEDFTDSCAIVVSGFVSLLSW